MILATTSVGAELVEAPLADPIRPSTGSGLTEF